MTNKTLNKIILSATTAMFLTACGGGGGSENKAPTADAGADASVVVDTTVTLTGSGTDTDGTIVSYSWTDASGTVLATTASFDYTPTSAGTTETFTLTVTDDDGAKASDSVEITVNPVSVSVASLADAAAQTYTVGTAIPTLTFTNSGGPVASCAVAPALPAGLTVAANNSTCEIAGTPTAVTATATYTVTGKNATGSDTATVAITVNADNQAPTADAGDDVSVVVNTAVTLTGTGTDNDGDIVSYSWTDAAGHVLATTASFDYTPISTETLTLTVTDDDNATATDTVVVTVEPRFSSDDTTVTDGVTGLVWDKSAALATTCATKGKVIPTIEQFQTIIDYEKYDFAISDEFNLTDYDDNSTTRYITSDDWRIRLYYGQVNPDVLDYNKTICVNASNEKDLEEVTYEKGAETDSNVTARTDSNSSLLVWSDYNSTKTTFLEAEKECANRSMLLPKIEELDALYDRTNKKIISDEFTYVEKDAYWTSTVAAADENQTWVIHFGYGGIEGKFKTDTAYVRCVK